MPLLKLRNLPRSQDGYTFLEILVVLLLVFILVGLILFMG
jgi:type II secretory pathway pseudopilin PulG